LSEIIVKINKPVKGVNIQTDSSGRVSNSENYNGAGNAEDDYQRRSEAAYQIGFEDGKKIGIQETMDQLKKSMQTVQQIIDSFNKKREELKSDLDSMAATLAIHIANVIIRREISADHSIVKSIAKEAINMVENKRHIVIRVNPADKEIISGIAQESLSVKDLEIREDSSVDPGGCIVENEQGIIDAQIETQLQEIADKLF